MPLSGMENGAVVRIIKVGGLEETHRHLEELGFVPGAEVQVVSKISGNLILQVMDSRVALDGELAKKIKVTPVSHPNTVSGDKPDSQNNTGTSFATAI